MKRNDSNSSMYSGTPCDECGGPTLTLGRGSIWCPAEDPHPGGHFVTRVAFERTPARQAAFDASGRKAARTAIAPRASRLSAPPVPPKPIVSPYGGGMDDFVTSDEG